MSAVRESKKGNRHKNCGLVKKSVTLKLLTRQFKSSYDDEQRLLNYLELTRQETMAPLKGSLPLCVKQYQRQFVGKTLTIGGYNDEIAANLFGKRKRKLRIPAKALLAS